MTGATAYERLEAAYRAVHAQYAGRVKTMLDQFKDPVVAMPVAQMFDSFFAGDADDINLVRDVLMYERSHPFSDSEVIYSVLSDIAIQASKSLNARGVYNVSWLMTPQEHRLLGSTPYANLDPHRPQLYRDNQDPDIDLLNVQREKAKSVGSSARYFGLKREGEVDSYWIQMSLEPLGPDGRTIRDPQPLDKDGNPVTNYTKSDDFPYRRD